MSKDAKAVDNDPSDGSDSAVQITRFDPLFSQHRALVRAKVAIVCCTNSPRQQLHHRRASKTFQALQTPRCVRLKRAWHNT
eukprot:m.273407 g.273407  ORF g.273407 m.273407 type:complete len:81 (-) comp19755_c0_seq26:1935-2177(-)